MKKHLEKSAPASAALAPGSRKPDGTRGMKVRKKHEKGKDAGVGGKVRRSADTAGQMPAPKDPELFESPAGRQPAAGHRPVDSEWVSAGQLAGEFPFAGIDDGMLRRRGNELNPAMAEPWIPKPRGGKYEMGPTVKGLWAWTVHKMAEAGDLPRVCASMKDVQGVYHIPVEKLKFFREHGLAPRAFDASNRVDVLEFLLAAEGIDRDVYTGNAGTLKGLPGLEEWDKDREQARLARENRIAQAMENAQAQKVLHTREGIEGVLGEPLLGVAAGLKAFPKETGGRLRTLLASANVPGGVIEQVVATACAGVEGVFERLRSQIEGMKTNPQMTQRDADFGPEPKPEIEQEGTEESGERTTENEF